MKFFVYLFLILLTYCGISFSQNQTADFETKSFRETRDRDFRNPNLTPLLASDFANFNGLKYFEFEPKYRIKANFVKSDERKTFLMPTSTGSSRKYLKIGELNFQFEGKDSTLGAYFIEYSPEHPLSKEKIIDVFAPFKDLTNGSETYSAGRYLYVRLPKDGTETVLDFNLAYNPSCAYNDSFACTLPPKENFLKFEIKAGEKVFKIRQ